MSPVGAGLPLCFFVGQGAATVEELVSLHDVQAYRQTHCQNSRCQFGVARLLERHRPAGGTAAPAGGPPGLRFDAPVLVVSESLGARWRNPQRGFEEREPSGCGLNSASSRSLSMAMLTSPLKLAPASASAASGLFHGWRPAPAPVARWVRQKGSYLVDPASSHMLVSKIKPCMSKYKLLYTVKLRMAH